ncbi:putative membrane protein [Peptoclostridium litorale DSM 5388]|uniref:SHOCT domain-containing protein n=1 Tax=Peptoclostridium litorale DSM 5388 TaxID=1121324 RepID=A0A069RKD8_PEPLI|nr:SHOCT domain-containing protein [Peptoclostridium litorale]KDR96590.1 hypothetical protein CLIT_2c01960 [Peptoclostridium litorale DSM 5388]SIN68751.1 putative membrane protein [Peptoclostridium litorale DSM 5388]
MHYGYGGLGGWWFFMFLVPIVFVIIIAYAAYKMGEGKNGFQSSAKSAEDILAERFAKGEISEDEYIKMKAALKK